MSVNYREKSQNENLMGNIYLYRSQYIKKLKINYEIIIKKDENFK